MGIFKSKEQRAREKREKAADEAASQLAESKRRAGRRKEMVDSAYKRGLKEGKTGEPGGGGIMARMQSMANNPLVKGLGSAGGAFMENAGMGMGSSGGSKKKKGKGKAPKFAWET